MKGVIGVNSILLVAVAIGLLIYSSSTSSLNLVTNQITFASSSDVQNFINMTEEQRIQVAKNMTEQEKEMIMNEYSKRNTTISENMSDTNMEKDAKPLMGSFMDGDGLHKAEGTAKVINLSDGKTFLRLENLKTTNGPDLYVYLSTDKDASDFVNLGRLKGNIGNQNYEIPTGTDLSKYGNVLIWCKAFSVLFGSAELSNQ